MAGAVGVVAAAAAAAPVAPTAGTADDAVPLQSRPPPSLRHRTSQQQRKASLSSRTAVPSVPPRPEPGHAYLCVHAQPPPPSACR